MALMTFTEALWSATVDEMRRNQRILVMGQDVELEAIDAKQELGQGRIRNTPISEAAFIGAGIGAALTGMRPVVVLGCSTFLYSAMDQVVNQAAKIRYMFGGQGSVPLVVRAPVLYSISSAAHHSDRPWGLFAQAPGLKIIVPTTPYDAKGLLTSAIRDGNPVLCFEDVNLFDLRDEIPESDYTVPIGVAAVRRAGSDVTIVGIAAAVHHSLTAAAELERGGISAEVIDLRTIVPLDRETVLESVAKTGRLIVVDPAPGMCGVAAEIVATVAEKAFSHLKAPAVRLSAPDIPVPFSPKLERMLYPTPDAILSVVRSMLVGNEPSSSALIGLSSA